MAKKTSGNGGWRPWSWRCTRASMGPVLGDQSARRELDQRQGTWRRRWGVHRHVREALVELMIQAWLREREHRLDALVQDPVGIV